MPAGAMEGRKGGRAQGQGGAQTAYHLGTRQQQECSQCWSYEGVFQKWILDPR